MTFVNEKDEFILKNRRTIDYERNVILKHGGHGQGSGNRGRPDPGEEYFLLQGSDFYIHFEGCRSGTVNAEGTDDLVWEIRRIWDLEGIAGREKEIMDLIVESITTYGVHFGKKNVNSITVNFSESVLERLNIQHFKPVKTLETMESDCE